MAMMWDEIPGIFKIIIYIFLALGALYLMIKGGFFSLDFL
jgi:hypothetical protein